MSESWHLFERFGVELEYMIVDRRTLDVCPISDRVLHAMAGAFESEVEVGPLNWSNELVLHVIELKTGAPAERLDGLAGPFQHDVQRINEMLAEWDAILLPTGAHPWMDPFRETRLWPHEYSPVYAGFDRIFDCRGHGWSNLQSTHLNLPFCGDEEFGRLHAAIRLVLPILPALAASSPMLDGARTSFRDARLEVYRQNARRIPSVSGAVIPEPVFTREDYEREILQRIYRDLAPFDPEGVLQFEWANARGAIARFDRNTIEIRVLDVQECPLADVAMTRLIVETLRALVEERWCSYDDQRGWGIERLQPILLNCIRHADETSIEDAGYLALFGFGGGALAAGMLWEHLRDQVLPLGSADTAEAAALDVMMKEGCLARRIIRLLGEGEDRDAMVSVYRRLSQCLAEGRMLRVAD
ncbi:MAG: glutamate--cysteine ligase [Phycisphaerae bacterium]|nr:glutamate--cysteine ligase [Phycisphaerae bacterium]